MDTIEKMEIITRLVGDMQWRYERITLDNYDSKEEYEKDLPKREYIEHCINVFIKTLTKEL